MNQNDKNKPYVYIGQANLFNKYEACAELAKFANDIQSTFVHKPGVYTGFIDKGKIIKDENYKNRMERIGFTFGEDGEVLSAPEVNERPQDLVNIRRTRSANEEALDEGGEAGDLIPRIDIPELLGSTHRKKQRTYNTQKFGENPEDSWTVHGTPWR